MRSKSDVSKPHIKPAKGVRKKDPPPQVQAKAQSIQNVHLWQDSKAPKPREPLSPDQSMEAARARVVKLQGVLTTLGEDDEKYTTILEALRMAQSRAQERPVSERIQSTQLFVERKRKRLERAKEIVAQARDTLAVAIADQEQQEVLLADGKRRLAEMQFEEKAVPLTIQSGSTTHRSRSGGAQASAGHHRLSSAGACLVGSSTVRPYHDGRRQRRCCGWTSPQEVEGGAVNAIGHHIRPCAELWDTVEMSEGVALRCSRADVFRRVTRFGMRGERVGEASNPGPRFSLRRRSTVVDVSSDSNGEASASARDVHIIADPGTSQPNPNANRLTPLALQPDDDEVSQISRRPRRRRLVLRQSRCSVEETEIDRESAPSVRLGVPFVAQDAQDSSDNVDSLVQSGAESTPHVRRYVQKAAQVVQSLADRVCRASGTDGQDVPIAIRKHQWSVFIAPLMWAAAVGDNTCPVVGKCCTTH